MSKIEDEIRFKKDLEMAMFSLQEMTDSVTEWQVFTKEQEKRYEITFQNLAGWKIKDQETRNYVKDVLKLMFEQFKLNRKINELQEKKWKSPMKTELHKEVAI